MVERQEAGALRESLARLNDEERALFAASCASSLLPLYEEAARLTGGGNSEVLRSAVDAIWARSVASGMSMAELEAACLGLVTDEDDDSWNDLTAVANNAAAAAVFALRALGRGRLDEAYWAGVQVEEALDYMEERTDAGSEDGEVAWALGELLSVASSNDSDHDDIVGQRLSAVTDRLHRVWKSFVSSTPFGVVSDGASETQG